MASDAETVINRFVGGVERGDVAELLDFFTDDAVWHPMPMKAAVGKIAIREALTEWLRLEEGAVRGEVHRQVSDGEFVMHERTDRFSLRGREMQTAVGAAFEIQDGRIAAWREYFDMSPFVRP